MERNIDILCLIWGVFNLTQLEDNPIYMPAKATICWPKSLCIKVEAKPVATNRTESRPGISRLYRVRRLAPFGKGDQVVDRHHTHVLPHL